MADARILLSITEGTFEIEGPEAFVSKQLEAFGDVIRTALSESKAKQKAGTKAGKPGSKPDTTNPAADYSAVFEIDDGAVEILSDIPGNSDKQKTVNAALIAAFAMATEGTDVVRVSQVREICKRHSCLNAPNFASYLKSEKKAYILSGTGKNKTIKLTVPGKKKARALLDELSGNE